MDNYKIGKQIKIARIKQDITQEKLAEIVGISPTHLSNIECGRKTTTLETLVELAKVLNISMDQLLCYEPNMPMQKQVLSKNIERIIADCTAFELTIIEELIIQIKKVIREASNQKDTKV